MMIAAEDDHHSSKASVEGEDDPSADATSEQSTSQSQPLPTPSSGGRSPKEDIQKLEARRAYNRKCAANARKRSKELVVTLQSQVEQLTRDKQELQRANDVMRAQVELLESQNRSLLTGQQQAPIMMQPQAANLSNFLSLMPQGMNNMQQLSMLARQMQQQQGMLMPQALLDPTSHQQGQALSLHQQPQQQQVNATASGDLQQHQHQQLPQSPQPQTLSSQQHQHQSQENDASKNVVVGGNLASPNNNNNFFLNQTGGWATGN